MKNRFIKQIIFLFVLPTTLLFSIFFLLVFGLGPNFPVITPLLIMFIMWSSWVIYATRKVADSLRDLEQALLMLREGKTFRNKNFKRSHLCGIFLGSLEDISMQMNSQQEELKAERISRLRSVIDGQDQERHRLSRELHDGIGQSLIAVKLQLESAGELTPSQMRASIDVAKGMIDQTIDEIRRVTNALLPAALNEFGLITALRTRCEEMATTAGLLFSFENTGSVDRLDDKSKTYLYRITQEAISNIIKHARASSMSIKLLRNGNEVSLIVSDNGKGFIFDPVRFAHRNGLQNIRERASLLNGTFEIRSQPDAGTTLQVSIPYITGNGKNKNHPG
ncbi:MAG: sensor histidine kinase [Bacteroidales bacterium]|nr:sensor histidine kinase [Bacteroidales bacterium]